MKTGTEREPSPCRKCLCDWCTRVSPMRIRIMEALPPELQHDFDYLMSRLMCAEMERDADNAKLTGEWPVWEWMKEARKEAERVKAKPADYSGTEVHNRAKDAAEKIHAELKAKGLIEGFLGTGP